MGCPPLVVAYHRSTPSNACCCCSHTQKSTRASHPWQSDTTTTKTTSSSSSSFPHIIIIEGTRNKQITQLVPKVLIARNPITFVAVSFYIVLYLLSHFNKIQFNCLSTLLKPNFYLT